MPDAIVIEEDDGFGRLATQCGIEAWREKRMTDSDASLLAAPVGAQKHADETQNPGGRSGCAACHNLRASRFCTGKHANLHRGNANRRTCDANDAG